MLLLRAFSKHTSKFGRTLSYTNFFEEANNHCHFCGDRISSKCNEPAGVLTTAPEFRGRAWYKGEFKNISSLQYRGKYLVLFFYPGDFTFVCPTEIVESSNAAEKFRKNSIVIK